METGVLIIPSHLRKIEERSFMNDPNIVSVQIESGVTQIGEEAFRGCKNLKEIYIPDSVCGTGRSVFRSCVSLERVHLSAEIKILNDGLFRNCANLKKIIVPEGIVDSRTGVFAQCKSLVDVELPKTLQVIGDSMFRGCRSLIQLVLPEGVQELHESAFARAVNLQKIYLPRSISAIVPYEKGALLNCTVYAHENSYACQWMLTRGYHVISIETSKKLTLGSKQIFTGHSKQDTNLDRLDTSLLELEALKTQQTNVALAKEALGRIKKEVNTAHVSMLKEMEPYLEEIVFGEIADVKYIRRLYEIYKKFGESEKIERLFQTYPHLEKRCKPSIHTVKELLYLGEVSAANEELEKLYSNKTIDDRDYERLKLKLIQISGDGKAIYQYCKELLSSGSSNPNVLYAFKKVCIATGHTDEAITILRKYAQEGGSFSALYPLIELYTLIGDDLSAREVYAQMVRYVKHKLRNVDKLSKDIKFYVTQIRKAEYLLELPPSQRYSAEIAEQFEASTPPLIFESIFGDLPVIERPMTYKGVTYLEDFIGGNGKGKHDNDCNAQSKCDEQAPMASYVTEEKSMTKYNGKGMDKAMDKTTDSNENRIIQNVGIDLGTTNTVVSYIDEKNQLMNLIVGSKIIIPSAIFFESPDLIYYGENALNRARKNSQSIVRLFKRIIGNSRETIQVRYNKIENETCKEDGSHIFVVDTNCFCDDSDLLGYFRENETVVLPVTVSEELQFRAKQAETQYTAKSALQNLAEKEKYACRIEYETSDLELLPKDFFRPQTNNEKNDNKILSVAKKVSEKYKDKEVVLITSDRELGKIKAPQCDINAISLKEFKLERLPEQQKLNSSFSLTGEDATRIFLKFVLEEICKKLNCDGANAVITVPVNFNQMQVDATKRAALGAGFQDVYIQSEPIAAATAYSMDQETDRKILVYDFGGGTFDVAIVSFDEEKNELHVLGTAGDAHLGGQDITNKLTYYIKEKLRDECGLDLFDEEESGITKEEYYANLQIIEREAERVKESLTYIQEESINILNLYTANGTPLSKEIPITREELVDEVSDPSGSDFETVNELVRRTIKCTEEAIQDANLQVEMIDVVILAGGASLMPLVQQKVKDFFGKAPFSDKDPATLIANGAALIAETHWAPPKNVNIDRSTGSDRLRRAPTRREKVIADLGVALFEGDEFDPVIRIGTPLPAKGTRTYYLLKDGQEAIDVKVYSRKRNNLTTKYTRCDYLDTVSIRNIPELSKRDVVVNVTFEITEEYELKVSADIRNKNTGEIVVPTNEIRICRDSAN